MSSSSYANPSSQFPKHDVFISFRGEDTRFNFVSHLHDALCRNRIKTYIDEELEKGDGVWPSLEKAIEDSALFLVIFSENYASSTWCLKELTKILDYSKNQDHFVIPVFYRVDPSDVRKQSKSYQRAFEEHKDKSINTQQLQKWREALTYAANLSGWHCSSNRKEARLILEIVECVVQKLDYKDQSEDYLKDKIGIHKRMANVESLLLKGSNNVQFIGIWGMGGMGKTTLATAIFKKLCYTYEGSCFLANVREESKKYGIDALKKKLVLTLLEGRKEAISSYDMRRLGRQKNFVVLDDVDDHEHIEELVENRDRFGPGSKILITARDKQVFGKIVDDIYKLESLNFDEGFQLFSLNAFRKGYVDPEVRRLAISVINYTKGNPLALKVLGSFLYGKNQEAWENQLKKLRKLPYPKINNVLKLSFEGLDYEEKNIFLDIACFFSGYYVENVKEFLDASGYSTTIGLQTLEDKALLDICNGKIYMHHLIEEMGRQIVREESLNNPKNRSRLWNPNEISEILKKSKGSEAIEGITLNISEVEEMCLSPQVFCSMPNLKFLNFHYFNFNDRAINKLKFPHGIHFLPEKLILLCWAECTLKSLPASFKGENLVEFSMPNSNLTKLWDGVQNLVNLRRINLNRSENLIELPDFSKAINLEHVDLHDCSKLRSVHPSVLSLNSLRYLWLYRCTSLTSLTSNNHLKSLESLCLFQCTSLREFSVTSENCRFRLSLSHTAIDDNLCSTSGHLSKIDSLTLYRCTSLTSLPYKLADLSNLRILCIGKCNKLASNLRSIFDEIRGLKELWMEGCNELFEVPDDISLLSSLRKLYLFLTNIETLPLSIKHLSSLQCLHLGGCKRLRFLPELPPSIRKLNTEDCLSLRTLHLPLMNESEERKTVDYDDEDEFEFDAETDLYFNFMNCMKLDPQSIKAAEAKVALEINKSIHKTKIIMKYPGERVPEWFIYRNTKSFLTVDLSSIPQPWDGNFIFCAVLSESSPLTSIDVKWFIDGKYSPTYGPNIAGEVIFFERTESNKFTLSDVVILWHFSHFAGELERKIEEKNRDAQSNTDHPLIQVQFGGHHDLSPIKECGICPTSAHEYQNYIQQIKLALQLLPHSTEH